MFDVPILYLTYNRPEETKRTFENLLSISPSKLYIAQDGPKNYDDKARTDRVTEIIRDIPHGCEVHYAINEKNMGCRKNVNTALDWFFENEEMGIIIEDDIIAHPYFFQFAEVMLNRYRWDERIMLISGNNVLGKYPGEGDYFFSRIGAIWGWATWRRSWIIHDKSLAFWPKVRNNPILNKIIPKEQWHERVRNMDKVYSGEIDTWDYQFTMTRLINSGLSILPRTNLIENIGFNSNATHTKLKPDHLCNTIFAPRALKLEPLLVIAPDPEFDDMVFNQRNGKRNSSRIFRNWLSKTK